jgi:hypothetical protein
MSRNDPDYAFPQSRKVGEIAESSGGLTKREYFAGKALLGLITNEEGPYFGTVTKPYNPWPWYAEKAFAAADAMIAEGEK